VRQVSAPTAILSRQQGNRRVLRLLHLLEIRALRVVLRQFGEEQVAEPDDHSEMVLEFVDELIVRVGSIRST
jgi:hypothetical protein